MTHFNLCQLVDDMRKDLRLALDRADTVSSVIAETASSASTNKPQAEICQCIVEDQLNYLIRNGLCFKDGEKDSVRDNLYRIIDGKLSAMR